MEIDCATSQTLDLDNIRSRVRELEDLISNWDEDSPVSQSLEAETLLKDCALSFQSRIEETVLEWSDVAFLEDKDFDACVERLTEELNLVEAETAERSQEIEVLSRNHAEDFSQLEIELESLKCTLEYTASQDLEKVKAGLSDNYPKHSDQSNTANVCHGDRLELLELENQIKKKNFIFKSLEELDSIFKWFDATEQIEDSFSSVKVIALDENCIRFSLQTYISVPESVLSQQKIKAINIPSEVKHELLIEVMEGTLDQKNVEIFPNDVHIGDIMNAAKDFGKSSLHWFVTKVQDRIVLCTIRQLVVKSANQSGHSFEYSDKDGIMVVHLAGGVDASIKLPQGWPMSNSPLKLTSLKNLDHNTNGFSSNFLYKVKDAANSQAASLRQNLSSFVDAIEKSLVEQKSEFQSN